LNEDNHDDVLNVPMSPAEIENVILNLHNDKSSGLDNVTNEYFRKVPKKLFAVLSKRSPLN
jgi:hypothetical protein